MKSTVSTVSVHELAGLHSAKPVDLVDVRTPAEFREVHPEGARNLPLESLDPRRVMAERNGNSKEPLYLICRTGNRSAQAYRRFADAGFENVVNVEGGVQAWESAGLPVVRGKKAISLERQVRIAAGLLVLVGAMLALFVHPYFALISAFVGAGLMFSGITDTCGMALLLARMPWNQIKKEQSCCSR